MDIRFTADFFGFAVQQTNESNLQLTKRRVEREAADYKQKALKYETFFILVDGAPF